MNFADGFPPAPGLYFHDRACLDHDPREQAPWAPENPTRLEAIEQHLAGLDWLGWEVRDAVATSEEEIELIHSEAHVARIRELAECGGGPVDMETWVGEASYRAALHAAGAACGMTHALLDGQARCGFCAVRPPGHHAERERAMGFCLFNNVAIAAELAVREMGLDRVFVLDWDIHHGNGTNEAFRYRPDVLFASIHELGAFPGTGAIEDAGSGPGEGYTINLPVPPGSEGELWLSLLEHVVLPAARAFEPQLILISAGYDAHRDDPLCEGRLQTSTYAEMTRHVRDVADELGIPFGAVLEGGYQPEALSDCVRETMIALAGHDPATSAAPEALLTSRAAARVGHYWPL
jgi:acetoin utilization deacetylase AcuC-like enzyme